MVLEKTHQEYATSFCPSYTTFKHNSVDLGGGIKSLYINTSDNRITGWSYDNAGNLLNDGSHSYTYNADNKIRTVDSVTAYVYDGNGRRVRKLLGENLRFVYGIAGQQIAEFSGSTGALKKEYIYGASGLVATIEPTAVNSNGTRYTTSDHLGSPRVVSNSSAGVVSRHDYMPFGEELGAGVGGRTTVMGFPGTTDGLRQKFTSKERDIETGLDHFEARYYSSTQGRFTGVDPREIAFETTRVKFLAYLGNPQNWNRYAYVLNNPLALTDPDGREPNKDQAATVQQIVAIVQQTERDNPNASPREILQRVDGFFQAQQEGPGNARYVYTQEKGWVDFRHFFAAANQAASVGEVVTSALGVGVELYQTVTRSTSAFSYEDLGSNDAGADFGDDSFDPNGGPLSAQVGSYLNNLNPLAPTAAPNYASLPTVADLGSRTNQSNGSRTLDSSTTSRQGGGPQCSSGAPAANPPPPRRVNSSGNQRRPEEEE